MGPRARDLAVFARAAWRPERPDRLVRAGVAGALVGPTLVGAVAASVARYPMARAVVDDRGAVTYHELWRASDAVAHELRRRGVRPGVAVGVLCRNHRGFVTALLATAKLGADLVLLNTGFAGPQLADVTAAESVHTLVHDDEFADMVGGCDVTATLDGTALAALSERRLVAPLRPARAEGRWVILTSGTTGRPKGAGRRAEGARTSAAALLATIPIRARDTVVVAPPLFHAWGLAHLTLGLGLSATLVLSPAFDPAATLAAVAVHRADGLVVVPVMLQRLVAEAGAHGPRTPSLRYVASSGSQLGAGLAVDALRRFGPVIHNVYGSTEVALATVAGPADLLAAPGTAGRPAPGSTVRVVDGDGRPVPDGAVGRILVGSDAAFAGYTDGTTRARVDGLLATGDVGHLDGDGRLFVDGREDDMIVSGGENVYPAEVEDCLAGHPAVADVAVVGVDDAEFGQRLQAHVVVRDGHTLDADQVRAHVRERLARFKVPGQVVFVDRIPRTPSGKVLRRALR